MTGGLAATPSWKKYDLISHDLIHYNNMGYQLQGSLLLNALAKGYNIYEKKHPYNPQVKANTPKTKPTTKTKVVKEEVVKAAILPPLAKPQPEKTPLPSKTPEKPAPPPAPTTNPNSHIKVEYGD